MRALLLPLGDEWRALEIGRVREVVAAPRPTPVPGVPAGVLGVFNLRGEILPLFDVAVLLGLPPTEPLTCAVVAELAEGPAGLAASALPGTDELGTPVDDGGQPAWHVGDRLVRRLDLEALLAAVAAPAGAGGGRVR